MADTDRLAALFRHLAAIEPYEQECIERDAAKGSTPAGITMTRAEWDRRYLLGRLAALRAALAPKGADK